MKRSIAMFLAVFTALYLTAVPANCAGTDHQSPKDMTTVQYYSVKPGIIIQDNCEDGGALIDKMLSAASGLNNYRCDYQMLVHKGQQIIKETGVIYFRKPKLFRVEVKEGPKKGALAILCSDGKVHGHLGGVMKYFSAVVSPDSSLARAINDFPMVGSDFYSLAAYLKNMLKQGDMSLSTVEPVRTTNVTSKTYVVDMYKTPAKKMPLLLKRIYVDPNTYLPVYWEDYVDGNLWSESSWNNLLSNLTLPNNLFAP